MNIHPRLKPFDFKSWIEHNRELLKPPVPGSIGLVVESPRMQGMKDGFEWYCFECKSRVHRIEAPLGTIVDDLPPLYEAFYADEEARRCPRCSTVHPGKGDPPEGWVEVPAD